MECVLARLQRLGLGARRLFLGLGEQLLCMLRLVSLLLAQPLKFHRRVARVGGRAALEVGEARAYGNKMYSEASCARKETKRLISELAARDVD